MTKKAAREFAATLYLRNEGLTMADIAAQCGVHPNTVTKWRKADNWDGMASVMLTTRHEQLKRYYMMLKDQNDMVMAREPGKRHFSKAEADSMAQTIKAIDVLEKELKLGTIVECFSKFLAFSSKIDGEATKGFAVMLDKFIKSYDA